MSKNHLAAQIDSLIDRVVLPMESMKISYISTDAVAVDVVALIDPETIAPELMQYASLLHVKQCVRHRLAKRHDPVEKAEEYAEGVNEDLFGDSLQPYYPVKRDNDRRYARKEVLSEADVEIICARMEKAGRSLLDHADALKAWFKSKEVA